MKKMKYTVTGMTCASCATTVKNALEQLAEILEVEVDLENDMVIVDATAKIGLTQLQAVLAEPYRISALKPAMQHGMPKPLYESSSIWWKLRPLVLILSYIFMASLLLNGRDWVWQSFMFDYMGIFFIVFSFFKLLDPQGFQKSFAMYDPIAKKIPVYAIAYPFIETTLGLMFLFRYELSVALVATILVLGFTTIGVARTLLDKRAIRCACLGTVLELPMTEATLIENVIMIIMAIASLVMML